MDSQSLTQKANFLTWLTSSTSVLFLWLATTIDPKCLGKIPRGHFKADSCQEKLAEIDGGPIEAAKSVFEHIEEGLIKNPDQKAVICLHQDKNHLSQLIAAGDPCVSPAEEPSDQSDQCLTLTYRQLHHTAQKLAAGILANNVKPNSSMLMIIPNGGEYALLVWICAILRITYVCVDESMGDSSSYRKLREIMKTVKPSLIVVSSENRALAVDFAIADLNLATPVKICLADICQVGWKSLLQIMKDSPWCAVDPEVLLDNARNDDPNRINSIIFTSGTSGTPKGCPLRVSSISHILSSQSWLINKDNCARALQAAHNSRGIAPAQTLQTWKAGGAVVMTSKSCDVGEIVEALQLHKPSFIALSPAMVSAIWQRMQVNPFETGSVRSVQVGGEATTRTCLSECTALFNNAKVFANHGMTEGGGSFLWPFFDTPLEALPRFGELCPIGKVAAGSTVRIWRGGNVARRCELGDLHIKGSSLLRQYMSGESGASFLDDEQGRWFVTGDTAMIDNDGVVFILGRTKDMISKGGSIVVPAAIESFLQRRLKLQVGVRNCFLTYLLTGLN